MVEYSEKIGITKYLYLATLQEIKEWEIVTAQNRDETIEELPETVYPEIASYMAEDGFNYDTTVSVMENRTGLESLEDIKKEILSLEKRILEALIRYQALTPFGWKESLRDSWETGEYPFACQKTDIPLLECAKYHKHFSNLDTVENDLNNSVGNVSNSQKKLDFSTTTTHNIKFDSLEDLDKFSQNFQNSDRLDFYRDGFYGFPMIGQFSLLITQDGELTCWINNHDTFHLGSELNHNLSTPDAFLKDKSAYEKFVSQNARTYTLEDFKNKIMSDNIDLDPDLGNIYVTKDSNSIEIQLNFNDERELYDSDDASVWFINGKYGASLENLLEEVEIKFDSFNQALDGYIQDQEAARDTSTSAELR